jgi:membrane-bound inhibitor of C-type lysozyme
MSLLSARGLLLCVCAAVSLGACTKPHASTYAYTCPDGYTFEITYAGTDHPGDIAIFADSNGSTKLPRAPAASGTRYANSATVFWAKGDEALVEQGGRVTHVECSTEPTESAAESQ